MVSVSTPHSALPHMDVGCQNTSLSFRQCHVEDMMTIFCCRQPIMALLTCCQGKNQKITMAAV